MATKPIKFLEFHYTMTQFLIKADKPRGIDVGRNREEFVSNEPQASDLRIL